MLEEYVLLPDFVGPSIDVSPHRPPYIAQGWTVSVNPEGSPFYIHRDKHLITDDPIQQAGICDKIMESEKRLSLLVETEGLTLPDDFECYITCDAESDKCKYYYVDYSTQTVFWLEEIDPERHDINMAPVCSVAQMSTSDICSSTPIHPRAYVTYADVPRLRFMTASIARLSELIWSSTCFLAISECNRLVGDLRNSQRIVQTPRGRAIPTRPRI